MKEKKKDKIKLLDSSKMSRKSFLKLGMLMGAGLAAKKTFGKSSIPEVSISNRPNFLFINVDQLSYEALSSYGTKFVKTPNIDRLAQRGVALRQSYVAYPVCCPSRACWFTGRFPSENGVLSNDKYPMHASIPDMGQWFTKEGYDAVHAGKWHVTGRNVGKSFRLISGHHGLGEHVDQYTSRSCEAFLLNYKKKSPFLLVAGLLNPHDICYQVRQDRKLKLPAELPIPEIMDQLPPLPKNYTPGKGNKMWGEMEWRYHIWVYYRYCEMVDAAVGRILDALESSGHADNTIVAFISDHGDQHGQHNLTTKGHLYESSIKVPFIMSCPGRFMENKIDNTHLVSSLDILSTFCDYAGIKPPPDVHGRSLRALLEGKSTQWRESVYAQANITKDHMVRTPDYKYITHEGKTEQLFNLKTDPFEMNNLTGESKYASTLEDHRKLFADWKSRMKTG